MRPAVKKLCIVAAGAVAVLLPDPASGWHANGHDRLARAAVGLLPQAVPAFFRQGVAVVGHAAEDPDLWKHDGAPQLRGTETPEHFLDVEDLEGRGLAPQRWAFVDTLVRRRLDPRRVGMLPYAIVEGTQKLALTFAEHRRWPQDEAIRWKALVYAGQLAHYAGDLAQPLHTTVHYDGRRQADGRSPRTGIHFLVDALFTTISFDTDEVLAGLTPNAPRGDLLPAVMNRFWEVHREVDRVYRLETDLRALENGGEASRELVAFTRERFRDGSDFLAGLLLRAWRDSAEVELPGWHDRGQGAGSGNSAPAAAGAEATDPRAVALAQRTVEAMGGRQEFDAVRLLHFTWQVERDGQIVAEREHWWDRETGDYRVEFRHGSGAPAVVVLNLKSRQGRALTRGAQPEQAESEELVERAYGAHINDSYWLLMPWKWTDPGVRLEWVGERSQDDRTFEVVSLSFVDGTGLTSGDRYWAWVDPESGLMDRWQYVLQQEDGSPGEDEPTTWIWSDWRRSGGVLFAHERQRIGGDEPFSIRFPVIEAIRDPSPQQLRLLRELAPSVPAR